MNEQTDEQTSNWTDWQTARWTIAQMGRVGGLGRQVGKHSPRIESVVDWVYPRMDRIGGIGRADNRYVSTYQTNVLSEAG